MQSENHHCKNCDHLLEDDHRYCPNCGQKTDDQLTISVLFSNTISNYFSVDARFFVSFLPLLFRPGYLPAKFVEGKRLRYLHPAQFYLFISVVFFFLLSFETRKQQQAFDETLKEGFTVSVDSAEMAAVDSVKNEAIRNVLAEDEYFKEDETFTQGDIDSILDNTSVGSINIIGDQQNELDSLIAVKAPVEEKIKALGYKEGSANWKKTIYIQALKIYEKRGGGLLDAFYDTIPIAMFFLLPIYALLLKLFFFRKGRFSHHLVFSFYFFSFLFTVFSIMLIANFIYPIPNWIDGLLIFGTGIYLILAIKRFYSQNLGEAIIRTFAVSFMYLMFVIPTTLVILGVVSFLIY